MVWFGLKKEIPMFGITCRLSFLSMFASIYFTSPRVLSDAQLLDFSPAGLGRRESKGCPNYMYRKGIAMLENSLTH
jgi:hypothetical protein